MSKDDDECEDPDPPRSTAHAWPAKSWERIARMGVRLAAVRVTGSALIRRSLPNESQHLFALTFAVGVVCGLVAVAFHLAIRAAEHLLIDRALRAEGALVHGSHLALLEHIS